MLNCRVTQNSFRDWELTVISVVIFPLHIHLFIISKILLMTKPWVCITEKPFEGAAQNCRVQTRKKSEKWGQCISSHLLDLESKPLSQSLLAERELHHWRVWIFFLKSAWFIVFLRWNLPACPKLCGSEI